MSDIKKDIKMKKEDLDKEVAKGDAERYLTDMKELPNYTKNDDDTSQDSLVVAEKQEKTNEMPKMEETPKRTPSPPTDDKPIEESKTNNQEAMTSGKTATKHSAQDNELSSNEDSEDTADGKLDNMPFSSKDVILGIINVITVILLIVLLVRIPEKADEVKMLRNENIESQSKVELESVDLEKSSKKAEALQDLFLDESGVVNYVSSVDKLKEGGTVSEITFASQQPVVDRTGNSGIPVTIKMIGSWDQIEQDLNEIQNLPFLVRPVNIEMQTDETGVLLFKYGVLLYVNKDLGKTR